MRHTIESIRIVASQNRAVRDGAYRSITEADAMLAHAFAEVAPPEPPASELLVFAIRWTDGHQMSGRTYVDAPLVREAAATGGVLRHLFLRSAHAQATGSPAFGWPVTDVRWTHATRADLVKRLGAEAAVTRNAGSEPRVARVHITTADNPAVRPGVYRSIAHADAMLAEAFAARPAPEGKPYSVLTGVVIWTDGYELRPRVFVNAEHVRDAVADGGILRHALLRAARAQASPETYRGWHPDVIARYAAAGREVLARIEADALHDDAHRNVSATATAPSLLPDPAAAIRELQERFAEHRRVAPAAGNDGEGDDDSAYPVTTHGDVQYVVNYITLALNRDLSAFDATAAVLIWNHWRAVRDTIETLLRVGKPTDEYADNEGLWVRQLPALVHLLDDTRAPSDTRRNGDLVFRSVGRRGEAYPPWIAALRGLSGAYVIRAPGASGELEIVYVGSSSADRLYETLTRHLQIWRRWQGYGRDYGEGHDPGLTYKRDTAEAAVIVTPKAEAFDLEMRLIETLRPRDNVIGQPNNDDWNWFHGNAPDPGAEEIPF